MQWCVGMQLHHLHSVAQRPPIKLNTVWHQDKLVGKNTDTCACSLQWIHTASTSKVAIEEIELEIIEQILLITCMPNEASHGLFEGVLAKR